MRHFTGLLPKSKQQIQQRIFVKSMAARKSCSIFCGFLTCLCIWLQKPVVFHSSFDWICLNYYDHYEHYCGGLKALSIEAFSCWESFALQEKQQNLLMTSVVTKGSHFPFWLRSFTDHLILFSTWNSSVPMSRDHEWQLDAKMESSFNVATMTWETLGGATSPQLDSTGKLRHTQAHTEARVYFLRATLWPYNGRTVHPRGACEAAKHKALLLKKACSLVFTSTYGKKCFFWGVAFIFSFSCT